MHKTVLPALYLGLVGMLATGTTPVQAVEQTPGVETQFAMQNRVDLLEKKITDLEARIERLERDRPQTSSNLPSDEEFDRTLNFMERFFQRFISIVRGLEEKETPTERL